MLHDLILNALPPQAGEALLSLLAYATVLRAIILALERRAIGTVTPDDDKALARFAYFLAQTERVLDWVSVGPTHRRR